MQRVAPPAAGPAGLRPLPPQARQRGLAHRASGRLEPREVVGSIDTSAFVVAVGGSFGFALGSQGIVWGYALALLIGGVIAAPIAASLVDTMPARVLGVAAGAPIVLWVSEVTWAVTQVRRPRALERRGVEAPSVPVVRGAPRTAPPPWWRSPPVTDR